MCDYYFSTMEEDTTSSTSNNDEKHDTSPPKISSPKPSIPRPSVPKTSPRKTSAPKKSITKKSALRSLAQKTSQRKGQNENTEQSNDAGAPNRVLDGLQPARLPVRCPLYGCNQVVGTAEVMAHYLRDHGTYEFHFKEIFTGQKTQMVVNLENLNSNENNCLGMLIYGGPINKSSFKLSECGVSRSNCFLPEEYECYDGHLPVLIMVCKTSNTCFIRPKNSTQKVEAHPSFIEQHIYIVWLTTIDTIRPLHCTITAFDKSMKISRSKIVKVRRFKDSQDAQEFACRDSNYLLLRNGEMRKLTHDGESTINVELTLNEF